MPRFFIDEINEENITLTGENARHIGRSLRMRTGEEITVCCQGNDYRCIISKITEDTVFLELSEKTPCLSEPSIETTLFQAVPKLDKLEYIIQKSTELGVSHIVPVLTSRCISRPSEKDFRKKLPRLNKIAEEAAKQSGRGIIPDVAEIIPYKTALQQIRNYDKSLILYEAEGGKNFRETDFTGVRSVALIIGSEGGFDKSEVQSALDSGSEQIWLGKRILRCETAPISTLSILMFLTNNM